MWIQVRTIDGKETRTVEDLSRLTKIESLRLKIQDIFNVSPQQQRLFYRGKQVMKREEGGSKKEIVSPTPVMQQSKNFLARALCFFFLRAASGVPLACFAAVPDPRELPVSIGIQRHFSCVSPEVGAGGPAWRLGFGVVGWMDR